MGKDEWVKMNWGKQLHPFAFVQLHCTLNHRFHDRWAAIVVGVVKGGAQVGWSGPYIAA